MRQHLLGGSPHLAVQAEHGNAVHRIAKVRRLDHVVLLVAAQPVLRTESRGDVEAANAAQRVERMLEVCRHRGGMREQRDTPALELVQQFDVTQ